MSKLEANQIAEVVFALVGDIEAYGETNIDKENRDNQKILTDVVDTLVWSLIQSTKYAKRHEYSMKVIGEDAIEFLGYLVEEYDLNDYVRKDNATD